MTHHPGGDGVPGGIRTLKFREIRERRALARLSGGTRMKFPSRYALLVCGPLTIWGSGCTAMTSRPVAHAGREVSTTDRLLSMAEVYEQKGQYQQAHKLYCQVLQQNPNHAVAREHATDLMAAISNAQAAKDPAAQQIASKETSQSDLKVSSVPAAPTDPALVGRRERKILSDEEVAARVPTPRAIAKATQAAKSPVATVTHEEAKAGAVTKAEQVDEQPLPAPVITLEQPITVVEAAPIKLPPVEPLFLEAPPEQIVTSIEAAPKQFVTSSETAPKLILASPEPAPLPVITSNKATTVVRSAASTTWTKTPVAKLCPNAPASLRGHLANLEATDPEARKAALEELANCGRSAITCLPAIRACLSDADPLVQGHAAWALWMITGESNEAIRCLSSILECNQEEAVTFACYILGSMGPQAQSVSTKLAGLQDDDSTTVRVHASEAILKICSGGAQAIQVLKATLASHKSDERCLAAVALGAATGRDRQSAISALIAALYDADSSVRCSAALALGGFGADAKQAISALEVAASATDVETKDAATTALACIRK